MTTIRMSYPEFRALVNPVIPMVSTSSIGALEAVRIRTSGHHVIAEGASATMMGMCVRPMIDTPPEFNIVFPIGDLPTHGPAAFSDIALEQTNKGTVIVEWSGGGTALGEYDVFDGNQFPDVATKVQKALTYEDRGHEARLSPTQMNAFAVAGEPANNLDKAPIVIHTSPGVHDLVLITCGRHFAGLASPLRSTVAQPRGKLYIPKQPVTDPIRTWTEQLDQLGGT